MPRRMSNNPPYSCADCGRAFFDMATEKHPGLIRQRVSTTTRTVRTKHDGPHHITTTVDRLVPPVLGSAWMPLYPHTTQTVHLCRYCAFKRGYVEGTDSPAEPPDADPPTTADDLALGLKYRAHPRNVRASVRNSVRNDQNTPE